MTISKQTRKLLNERLQMIDRLRHSFGREFGDPNDPDSKCNKCGLAQNHKIHAEAWTVECFESERGWGRSLLSTELFDSKVEADAYVLDYNKENTANSAPDYYCFADTPRRQ